MGARQGGPYSIFKKPPPSRLPEHGTNQWDQVSALVWLAEYVCSQPSFLCSRHTLLRVPAQIYIEEQQQQQQHSSRQSISAIMNVMVLCINEANAEALFVGRWKGFMNHDARIILRLILNLSFPVTVCYRHFKLSYGICRSVVCLSYQVKRKRQKLPVSNLFRHVLAFQRNISQYHGISNRLHCV
ncbi:unnamed protein product [Triticum turgidum subsp. durum]|uniref:Uncharacterized protein n=1 Tax=Triticum turgidum subsp. durum TaxID=4567 RepID=A0A9R0TQA3_TRITD|nr:unnamed protein product [Triticum turgidum subsp. durum]